MEQALILKVVLLIVELNKDSKKRLNKMSEEYCDLYN